MGVEESDKIVRDSGDKLTIKLTADEEKYRAKYLPDPKELTDEKLVCTVCSICLAGDIHKGKTVHVHRALKVLLCETCFNFYGDGCFSTDEDGDDKYCRWCGQGGTLFLCSACNCAFCQKCVKQNLKASVLADLENDDWKCYFCNPRPLFGCRTICWGALELNKIGIEKEKEKLKKQKEKLEKMEERKREKGERSKKIDASSEDEITKKKNSRVRASSSPEVMPVKKTRSSIVSRHINGNVDKPRRKRKDSSSDSESSGNKKVNNRSRSRNTKPKKYADSSSEDEYDVKSKKTKLKKKKARSSSESSEDDRKKTRRKSLKKKEDSSDESSDGKSKRKRSARRKKDESDSSSDHKPKKKRPRRKKRASSSDEESDKDSKKRLKKIKKIKHESSCYDSDDESRKGEKKSTKKNDESDIESRKTKHSLEKYMNDDSIAEIKLKADEVPVDIALMKKRIKLAVLWLSTTIKDISDLGTLISIRATKFGKKKINLDNLKTYHDVLNTVSKLKQLISGIHSNYDHIEQNLDAQLRPWKAVTGIEGSEIDKNVTTDDASTVPVTNKSNVGEEESTADTSDANKVGTSVNNTVAESNVMKEDSDMVMQWSGLSADEDSGEEHVETPVNVIAETVADKDELVGSPSQINESEQSQSLLSSNKEDVDEKQEICDENATDSTQEMMKTKDPEDTKPLDNGSENDLSANKESSEIDIGDTNDCSEKESKQDENPTTQNIPEETTPTRKSELKGQ